MSREKQINELGDFLWRNTFISPEDECYNVAETLVNAGYRKQSEGEWLEQVRVSKEGKPLLRHYKCNLCGVYLATQANYCPNCGAKMTGSAENATDTNVGNKSEWISVEERLPEITETVLIAYKEKWEWEAEWTFDVDVGSLDITGREWNTYHDLYEGQELHITHWMPLPEPPKMKGGAE